MPCEIAPNQYFNPHSPCGERRGRHRRARAAQTHFNPHSPCGERHDPLEFLQDGYKFQSTLPLRGATEVHVGPRGDEGISIHTPLAGSDARLKGHGAVSLEFQSTLPLRGATAVDLNYVGEVLSFQSTLPLRGATGRANHGHAQPNDISIHTPLAGSDMNVKEFLQSFENFNPHSPCGERPKCGRRPSRMFRFQSTLPLRGATWRSTGKGPPYLNFNPHSPCGERPNHENT